MAAIYLDGVSTPSDPDTNYTFDLDLAAGETTVTGDFEWLPDALGFTGFSIAATSGAGGSVVIDPVSGQWTFTIDANSMVGSTYTFDVQGTYADSNGRERTDTDFVQITFTCFATGTAIDTPNGPRAIETLAPGDLVRTRDGGAEPIRWIGSRRLETPGDMGAIVFAPGALGNARELRVSPEHRMLVTNWRAQVLLGEREMLVPARRLVNGDTIWQDRDTPVTWWHMLFDTHQIVTAEGIPSESYHPDATGLRDLCPATRAEVLELFPELADDPAAYGGPARPVMPSALGARLLA